MFLVHISIDVQFDEPMISVFFLHILKKKYLASRIKNIRESFNRKERIQPLKKKNQVFRWGVPNLELVIVDNILFSQKKNALAFLFREWHNYTSQSILNNS